MEVHAACKREYVGGKNGLNEERSALKAGIPGWENSLCRQVYKMTKHFIAVSEVSESSTAALSTEDRCASRLVL